MRTTLHHHLLQARGAHEEGALHTYAIAGDAAHGEIGIVTRIAHADDRPLELLGALVIALFDADKDFDHIPGVQLGDILILGCLYGLDQLFHHFRPAFLKNKRTQWHSISNDKSKPPEAARGEIIPRPQRVEKGIKNQSASRSSGCG